MSDTPETSLPILGPQRAARPHPLGKDIRLRIHLDGCKGLPQPKTPFKSSAPRKLEIAMYYCSSKEIDAHLYSSKAYEGTGCHQGTVKWDETLYITCVEHSLVHITLYVEEYGVMCECVYTAGDLLQVSSVSLMPTSWAQLRYNPIQECTLFISASAVPANGEEENGEVDDESSLVSERDDASSGLQLMAASWDVALRGLASFGGAVSRANIATTGRNVFTAQYWTYKAYQACSTRQSNDPQIDSLLKSLMTAVNTCVQVQSTRVLQRKDCIEQIFGQLYELAALMDELAQEIPPGVPNAYREEELARLVLILVTPDPPTGVNSTSTGGDWTALYGTIAKDALLFTLEGIVQSSDAFPPLKSAASGLLFFAASADMASNNKKHIRDIHKRVNSLATSLRSGAEEGSMLTPAHQKAIAALATDISSLKEELEVIVTERKNHLRRFFSAKRHREDLQDIVWQLDNARSNYATAVATLNATTNAQVLAYVRPMAVVMGINPVYAPGTRPVDAASFPFGSSRIEEV
ncbi:unnamed protein product [Peniophora sp. CBMAI 1063]|nr:unnamed protein product [Peniophora sp. CBMAI 1063]